MRRGALRGAEGKSVMWRGLFCLLVSGDLTKGGKLKGSEYVFADYS